MLYNNTLLEIKKNENPGVEYEIALFYRLLQDKKEEAIRILSAIKERLDSRKIQDIIIATNKDIILRQLQIKGFSLDDVSFETQNDLVGPADLVMYVRDSIGESKKIGLSVKYANTCTLNVTGRNFITESQITFLRKLLPEYTNKYITEMTGLYGNVTNWFRQRKPSKTTDQYIDIIRDAVIENWSNVRNKEQLFSALFHADSPIDYWVVNYNRKGYTLNTTPQTIDRSRANDVTVEKMETSYIAFCLDNRRVGHMQVKFNNGFLEKSKKTKPDIEWQGVKMAYGQPFSSWNFSVENK